MKNNLKDYLKYIREIDKEEKIKDKNTILENLLIKIQFTQHERLVHLLVTMLVGIATILFLGFGIITDLLSFIITSFITLILFMFYIVHYYFLENTTQELYNHYFSIKEKK